MSADKDKVELAWEARRIRRIVADKHHLGAAGATYAGSYARYRLGVRTDNPPHSFKAGQAELIRGWVDEEVAKLRDGSA